MKIYSWNVNGIRACVKNESGFFDFISKEKPDILALQETKAEIGQLPKNIIEIDGYKSYFHSATKPGYSGTALYTRIEPLSVEDLGDERFDCEGRVIIAHYQNFVLVNCYFPNSQDERKRLDYKLKFCDVLLSKLKKMVDCGKNVLLVGDYNIAHTEIDLKNPKSNTESPGFYWEEREWFSQFLASGFRDVFRERHKNEPHLYTWWSYRTQARERNVGWRIDYCCVNDDFAPSVKNAEIHANVFGSDHCPVSIEIEV